MAAPKEAESTQGELTEKQRKFCEEYVFDWNGARAARAAGYSEDAAKEIAYENLTKPHVRAYIEELKKRTAELAGVSILRVAKEYAKLAFTDASGLKTDWENVKPWEELTEDEKALIASVTTTKRLIGGSEDSLPIEEVRLEYKTHDKHKALEALRKMFGYDAAEKVEVTNINPLNIADDTE